MSSVYTLVLSVKENKEENYTMNNVLLQMSQPEYHNHFVNYLRDKGDNSSALAMGYHSSIGAYDVSPVAGNMLMKAIAKESDMYGLTTNIHLSLIHI